MYETARIEYDAYRTDLEFYGAARDTEINQLRLAETQLRFNEKKTEFEKLRSDVQIKLKFLDDNRVSRVCRNLHIHGQFCQNSVAKKVFRHRHDKFCK